MASGVARQHSLEMLAHLEYQCLKLTNSEKKKQLKETGIPWNQEEDTTIYFIRLDKEQERLKTFKIIWDETQKIAQAVDEIYNSGIFTMDQLID